MTDLQACGIQWGQAGHDSVKISIVDGVGSAHNVALLRLAEDLPQVHPRNDARLDGVRQHLARPHWRQLVHITCTPSLLLGHHNRGKPSGMIAWRHAQWKS